MKINTNEGLEPKDLDKYVSNLFTIDQYKSKMGDDQSVVVLGFTVKEQYPAADLMEFIEKGYGFILDADISAGEEKDGNYQVFVEIPRTAELPGQLTYLLNGISQLCNCYDWRFKYHQAASSVPFDQDAIRDLVPLTERDYESKMMRIKTADLTEFFNQGTVSLTLESNNQLTFSKVFAGPLTAKFIAIGPYAAIKTMLPGPVSLDESSRGQTMFLNKYIGNYDIHKIGSRFLIRNGSEAVILEPLNWN